MIADEIFILDKNMKNPRTGIWGILFYSVEIFGFGLIAHAYGMGNGVQPQKSEQQVERSTDNFTLRIDVEEVRVDAVVLDKNRNQITNLTKEDFEIRQDEKLQKIISCEYINIYQPQPKKQEGAAKESKAISSLPTPMPIQNEVRRNIVFLVDDLSMLFKQVHYARLSLRKFVETQMQPGDVIAIMQTSRGNAALQALTADKRNLLTIIDSIQWSYRNADMPPVQLPALSYCIKALQDIQGRKFLIYISTQGTMGDSMLADAAWRAGVVIHELNIRGLTYGLPLDAEPSYHGNERPTTDTTPERLHQLNIAALASGLPLGAERTFYGAGSFGLPSDNTQEMLQKLRRVMQMGTMARKTGGLYVGEGSMSGANFFLNGVGKEVEEEMKGYYLISYIPPPSSFIKNDQRLYHGIKISVKKPHQSIFTRDGYLATPGPTEIPGANVKDSLMSAMFSPFKYNAVRVNLASGYVDNRPKGYLLRAWLHLDGRDLGVMDEKDGGHSVSVETAASITDIMGDVQDLGNRQLKFRVNDKDIALIRDQGFKFAISLPGKSSGNYYVRVAIKDQVTGALGSAYQFIEIPDLKKEKLNLSSIFVVNREEDAAWLLSTTSREARENSSTSPSIIGRSQALRSYLPGESFEYMSIIYNAKSKQGTLPDLETHFVLYRDGEALYASSAEAVDLKGVSDLQRIPIRKKLQLESTLQPGDYILQLVATDKKADKKNRDATQVLPFEVLGKQAAN
jgi:VWFA-related protein